MGSEPLRFGVLKKLARAGAAVTSEAEGIRFTTG